MHGASLVVQSVKNPPAMQGTWVQSLGWEDSLEEGMATHSSILDGESPWIEKTDGLQSMGSQRVGHNWVTKHTHIDVCVWVLKHFSHVWVFVTLWTVVLQAHLSMGIFQARILEWVAMPSSRASPRPMDQTHVFGLMSCHPPEDLLDPWIEPVGSVSYVSCIGGQVLYH